jgi:hypothetical protein
MRQKIALLWGLSLLALLMIAPSLEPLSLTAAQQPTSAPAVVTTLYPSQDSTLYEDAGGSLSNGAGPHFFAGRTGAGLIRRGLVAFDVAGAIPPGSVIISAALTLHMSRSTSGPQPVALHRLLADWGEGTSSAAGEGGMGGAATTGDATWLHTFFDSHFWTTPGGEFTPVASASISVAAEGSYTWASTPQLQADAQAWLDDPANNFGWLLLGNETSPATTKRFNTRENSDPATRPQLTLVFEPVAVVYLPLLLHE